MCIGPNYSSMWGHNIGLTDQAAARQQIGPAVFSNCIIDGHKSYATVGWVNFLYRQAEMFLFQKFVWHIRKTLIIFLLFFYFRLGGKKYLYIRINLQFF